MNRELPLSPDILIIGSGIGGATMAKGLAGTGLRILVLERGQHLTDSASARDERAIFQRGVYRSPELWVDEKGAAFNPGTFYCVGGNSKFFGAVMLRFRVEDFLGRDHPGGMSVPWPFDYDTLEPWYNEAEHLFEVRGQIGQDPTEPHHSRPYKFGPVADEMPVAVVRERLRAQGLRPFNLPLTVDCERWLKRAATPWDGFPDISHGKMDAETGPLRQALQNDNVSLVTGAKVLGLQTDGAGKRINAVVAETEQGRIRFTPGLVVLSAGAVNSAALLLRSADGKNAKGLANSSGQVGRNFMNHNCSAMLVIDPRLRNDSIYQKTLGINDFYLSDPKSNQPLGNVQLLGKVSGPILKANVRLIPEAILGLIARYSFDWYLMSEDLAHSESRVFCSGNQIGLRWQRTNITAHERLVRQMKEVFRAAGFPIILTKSFGQQSPSHQCGTIRFGDDPGSAALDPFCKTYDHDNLYVVDGSFFPSSAAVNPSLTIAAQALRVADHLTRTWDRA